MNDRKVEILYRTTRYGRWNHLEVEVKKEVVNVRDYIDEYLKEKEVAYLQMQVIKVRDI